MAFYDRFYENISSFGLMASVLTCLYEYLNGNVYIEVKDKIYIIHAIRKINLKLRGKPKSPRTQYQVKKIGKIKKVLKVIMMN